MLTGVACRTVSGPADPDVAGVACDSRHVRPGFAFVAIPGAAQDGRRFIADALEKGAIVIVAESAVDLPAAVSRVVVEDAHRALAQLAKAFWQQASDRLQIVGVTGTNGKTTVAYLARDILERAGRTPGLISTVQYRIGPRTIPATRTTPDAPSLHRLFADMVANGCRSVAMEVSSHALDQQRVAGIQFDAAVFTNLTRDHLDYHLTMEAYYVAKRRLFESLGQGGRPATAVINAADAWGHRLIGDLRTELNLVTFGVDVVADVVAESLSLSGRGSTFRLCSPWGSAPLRLGLLGRHNVSNALAAAAAGLALGVPLDQIVAALARANPVPGRLQEVHTERGFQVFVDYAHSDDALERVLQALREITTGRLILVFGCGGNRDRSKRPAMGAIAARLADQAIVTSDNPRKEDPQAILADVLAGAPDAGALEAVVDRREAMARALACAAPGDIVLIAGKGHETFQEFANRTVPFDDAQIARDLLGALSRA